MRKSKAQTQSVKSREVEELKNQLARALADYDNLRKRTEEEKILWVKFATQKFIQNLLPILDALEAALVHTKDQGLAIAIGQLKNLLESEGLREIRPKIDAKFDESLEEVVEAIQDKEKQGLIAEVALPGWRFADGPIVRHAKVKVYKKET